MKNKNVVLALALFIVLGFSANAQSKKGEGKKGAEVNKEIRQSTEPQKGEVKLEVPTSQPAPQYAEPAYTPQQENAPNTTPNEMERGNQAPAQTNRLEPKIEKGTSTKSKATKGKK